MKSHIGLIALPIFVVAAVVAAEPAFASTQLTESLNDILPTNSVLLDFDSYYSGGNPNVYSPVPATIAIGTTTVALASGAYLAEGNIGGVVAAPIVSASVGPDLHAYLAAEPNAPVTIQYASKQDDFGLLWGSVDAYNTLSFYNCAGGGTNCSAEYSMTGSDVFQNPNGYQGYGGSSYVNVEFLNNEVFTAVQAISNSNPAFEFDYVSSVASGTTPLLPPVPEPGTWAMMLFGFAGIGFMVRKSRRNQSAAILAA